MSVRKYNNAISYQHGSDSPIGVLLTNLGTPDAPNRAALKRYLAEFLWDPRVIELPRLPWWLLLHGIILRTRPKKSAEAYQKIWTQEGSPLLATTVKQRDLLQEYLDKKAQSKFRVELGMRYGSPSIANGLRKLDQLGARRILILPLYGQYSAATVASTLDSVFAELTTWRWIPDIRTINCFHDDTRYIELIANNITNQWNSHPRGKHLLFSFHGVPERYVTSGDPYHCHCQKTARLVAEKLQLSPDAWSVAFQSRFGKEPWIKPYTDVVLEEMAKQGVDALDVVCPGFITDCLETLEEIAMQNRDAFLAAGGHAFSYIPALNAQPEFIEVLNSWILEATQDWHQRPASKESYARFDSAQKRYAQNFGNLSAPSKSI